MQECIELDLRLHLPATYPNSAIPPQGKPLAILSVSVSLKFHPLIVPEEEAWRLVVSIH